MEMHVTSRTHYAMDVTDAYAKELEDNNRPRRGEWDVGISIRL